MCIKLKQLLNEWENWAKDQPEYFDGWETGFPKWDLIEKEIQKIMFEDDINLEKYKLIEKCWLLSHEEESLSELASEYIDSCFNTVILLSNSSFSLVRFQAYKILHRAGKKSEKYLRQGLFDKDPYCRRMALISLSHLKPSDSKEIYEQFKEDSDPYIRSASLKMLHNCENKNYVENELKK